MYVRAGRKAAILVGTLELYSRGSLEVYFQNC